MVHRRVSFIIAVTVLYCSCTVDIFRIRFKSEHLHWANPDATYSTLGTRERYFPSSHTEIKRGVVMHRPSRGVAVNQFTRAQTAPQHAGNGRRHVPTSCSSCPAFYQKPQEDEQRTRAPCACIPQRRRTRQNRTVRKMLVVLAALALTASSSVAAKNCSEVQQECFQNATCAQLFLVYTNSCHPAFLSPQPDSCTAKCRSDLMAINATEIGRQLTTCSCGDDQGCEHAGANLNAACFGGPLPNTTTPAENDCIASVYPACASDPQCASLRKYYESNCTGNAFTGASCPTACNNSLHDLLANAIGQRFQSCQCITLRDECLFPRRNAFRTCLGIEIENTTAAPKDCVGSVFPRCSNDQQCNPLQLDYQAKCQGNAFAGTSCPSSCNESLHSLFANPLGRDFETCKCITLASVCEASQRNVFRLCLGIDVDGGGGGEVTTTPSSVDDCVANVHPDCGKNPQCARLQTNYLGNCTSAFQRTSCPKMCNESFQALTADPIGKRFLTCGCITARDQCYNSRKNVLWTCRGIDIEATAAPTATIGASSGEDKQLVSGIFFLLLLLLTVVGFGN